MCRAVTCRKCNKTTWAGCGQHVDSVMRGVRASDRCQGHQNEPSTGLFAKMFTQRVELFGQPLSGQRQSEVSLQL